MLTRQKQSGKQHCRAINERRFMLAIGIHDPLRKCGGVSSRPAFKLRDVSHEPLPSEFVDLTASTQIDSEDKRRRNAPLIQDTWQR